MRGKFQLHTKEPRMQKLLDRESQLEAELQRCQDNIDLFEEYYLQNSWRTGNIFLGWPICTYAQITDFLNRPRAKKNTKPYVEIADHEKLFSLSSVSSRPFINVSKVTYLATKDLYLEGRQRIPRSGNKSQKNKPVNERLQKIEKLEGQNVQHSKEGKEDQEQSRVNNSEAQEVSSLNSEESESENMAPSEKQQAESSQEEESQNESQSQNEQSDRSRQINKLEDDSEQISEERYDVRCEKPKNKGKSNKIKSVTYFQKNSKRTITIERQSFTQKQLIRRKLNIHPTNNLPQISKPKVNP